MRIEQIKISGFRGFRNLVTVPIAPSFTVVDGRNGVGKSTLFDAIEFALTGKITKYGDAKAAGETVEDYIWWKGDGPSPPERFVEVTFTGENGSMALRRTPIDGPDPKLLAAVEAGMVKAGIAPSAAIPQLCASTIIRDENIASLSLDLTETQRYAKLREAIGATDADRWTDRATRLNSLARKRSEHARDEVAAANAAVAAASRRVDEARAAMVPETAVAEAASTMARLLQYGAVAPDELVSPGRELVSLWQTNTDRLAALLSQWDTYAAGATALQDDERALAAAKQQVSDREASRAALPIPAAPTGTEPLTLVRQLQELLALGRSIGLVDAHCPLCAAPHDDGSFAAGLARATEAANRLNAEASARAAEATRQREAIVAADRDLADAQEAMSRVSVEAETRRRGYERWQLMLGAVGLAATARREVVERTLARLNGELEQGRHALRVLETLPVNRQLGTTMRALDEAQQRLSRAQDKAGLARRAEASTSALHDAARRAASETLDLRLQRVLPLMAELYGRLRPHPVWQDIEYAIRGDVRRFLSLQVGEGLNPQFLFSSGQRRATGLAFLLSINLSLAWSRWNALLLDDPVQHVNDFRTVNLAELLAQLAATGRQILVAVEDPALAELLARRMPVTSPKDGLRLTLGLGPDGSSAIVEQRHAAPMLAQVLAA